MELLLHLRTVVFIPNFGISYTIRQRIAHNRKKKKKKKKKKVFHPFYSKTESVHIPGVISLFLFLHNL